MTDALSFATSTAEETRALGRALGEVLAAGDLVMLSGELGAGKTTLARGIGAGMGVRGRVASPTFIVARVHPSLAAGPDLIHVDAYRIRDLDDLETLDLDSSLDEAVTVVEWGEGMTEAMSQERLEIRVDRQTGGEARRAEEAIDLEGVDDGARTILLRPFGTRWVGVLGPLLDRARELAARGESGADE